MRTYLKAFLFLALTASIACAGANFAQAAETAPAASAGNGRMLHLPTASGTIRLMFPFATFLSESATSNNLSAE